MTEYMDCGCPVPDAGQQDQAEQGLAQVWLDDELRRIVSRLITLDNLAEGDTGLTTRDFTLLCGALKIDIRDVT